MSVPFHGPLRRFRERRDDLHQRRLAGAVRPQEADDTRLQREVDITERPGVTVLLSQTIEFEFHWDHRCESSGSNTHVETRSDHKRTAPATQTLGQPDDPKLLPACVVVFATRARVITGKPFRQRMAAQAMGRVPRPR